MHAKTFRSICLVSSCFAGLGLAMPAASADPVTVSGPSPFAGCSLPVQPGTNYLNAEVEPWVDANPANPANLIAGWQQDRWSNGGARSLMSGYSMNGGQTWTPVMVPGISLCSGGTFDRASDPWVTISPDGTAYFMSLSFMNDEPNGAGGDNALFVNRSIDGGVSWSGPQTLILDTDGQIFNDKNAMTADPVNSNFVYAVWDRLVDFTLPSAGKSGKPFIGAAHGGDGAANARARYRKIRNLGGLATNPVTFFGPAYFARTTDGGVTWEAAKKIHDPGPNAQTINNLAVVLKNGDVVDFFTEILHNGKSRIGYVRSSDKGETFGPAQVAVDMNVTLFGTMTPDAREPVRDANILFDVAVDRHDDHHAEHHSGNIYLVWQDGRFQNLDRVAFSMSTNNGASWSTPVIISKTPYNQNKLRRQAFIPSVEVGVHHKVVVTYYDFRNDTNNGKEATDFWAISCDIASGANCRTAGGWGSEARLTPDSFNMLNAPVARGHFLGDYMGLVNAGGTVTAVFGKAVGPNLNDMFSTTIP